VAYRIVFRPAARADLKAIYDYISQQASRKTAGEYIARIETVCMALKDFPERGSLRDDLLPDIRIIGFERRTAIAFIVHSDTVRILRIFYGGHNFPREWLD
jgi:toxin ParE1/3/4